MCLTFDTACHAVLHTHLRFEVGRACCMTQSTNISIHDALWCEAICLHPSAAALALAWLLLSLRRCLCTGGSHGTTATLCIRSTATLFARATAESCLTWELCRWEAAQQGSRQQQDGTGQHVAANSMAVSTPQRMQHILVFSFNA